MQDADAVVEIFIGARPAAIDAREQRPAGQRHAGSKRDQRDKVAAIQRQCGKLGLIDRIAYRATGGLQQRRLRHHLNRVCSRQSELDIQAGLIAQPQSQTGLTKLDEPGRTGRERILARRKSQQVIFAAPAGGDCKNGAGGLVCGADLRFRHHRAGRVQNRTEQFGLAGLPVTGRGEEQSTGQHPVCHTRPVVHTGQCISKQT